MIKRIYVLLCIALLSLTVLFTACGARVSPLVGTWETTNSVQRGVVLRHVFERNGTGVGSEWIIGGEILGSWNFAWTSENGVITFTFDDGWSQTRTYAINDGRLTTVGHSPFAGEHSRQVWTRQ